MNRTILLALALALAGCHDHDHGEAHDHEEEHGEAGHDEAGHGAEGATAYTDFSAQTELFVEVPPLVAGRAVALAAHVTTLSDFRPLSAGTVVVELTGDGPPERFESTVSETPGIFLPRVEPREAGPHRLAISVTAMGVEARHELGEVMVFAGEPPPAGGAEAEPEGIGFTKEQQWRMDFALAPVRRARVRDGFEAYGTLRTRPGSEARVLAPFAGRVLAVDAVPQVGRAVAAGAPLLKLSPRSPQQADPAALEAAVQQAQLSLRQASAERRRVDGLVTEGAIADRRAVEARFEESRARAAVATARRRLRQARRVDRSDADADAVAIGAPLAGLVADVRVAPGVFVAEGDELMRIVDLSTLWLEVHVAEAHAAPLQDTRELWFEVQGYDGVFEVGPDDIVAVGTSLEPRSRTVPLYARVPNPGERLRDGLFATVHVVTGVAEDALTVPASAIVREGGLPVVYVQLDGEHFVRRQVRLGARDGHTLAVVEGLEAGERVVSRGAWAVRLAAAGTAVPEHGHAH